ncbi:MAG: ABC transporter permease subunit [Candidatus Micrarchaeales archaeon]|jgi:ABC-type Na+ efflux pump permease subunit|uniref:ABC transporter permease protein n=1 Tax=Candidatus Micrarchaeum acidiphilum ARMAN-2 TaxID=425595 RepID=C7DIK0_MICA2|nr:MAG: ABC transporter permease protein [Candidatus Micrarchaeum acidiphilum ARMAN-2]MCW6161029.1 ABC transporter permease subunit [Candidatus Micrarchaeales archaeon]
MNFAKARAIGVKDLKEVFSSISIYGPMIGVPLFFAVTLPLLTFYVALYAGPGLASRILPFASAAPGAANNLKSVAFMIFFSVNVLGPIFLTMPIFTASVIAADSFAGEKERKTSEALLATPVTKSELMVGKMLASFLPAVFLTIAIFGIYGGVVNYLAAGTFHTYILPNTTWLLMLLSAPFFSIAAIGMVVIVSSHVKGIKEAQQISTLLVLPILVLPFASIIGIVSLDPLFFVYVIMGLTIADALIVYFGIRSFRRESILG